MFKQSNFDPGLGAKLKGANNRVLGEDGNFNVIRSGAGFTMRDGFQHLVNMSWPKFLFYVFLVFGCINAFFAELYVLGGIEGLHGTKTGEWLSEFKQAFFFSIQTSATVGYGHMVPLEDWSNYLASFETLLGLLGLSVITGLLYGRFSRPRSSVIFSNNAIITPFKEFSAFQFKIVNRREETLMDVEVRLTLTYLEKVNGEYLRRYNTMPLELNSVVFMPLTWTLVHYINPESPLFGLDEESMKERQTEVIIQLKAFDETYNQIIYSRFSYPVSQWLWNVKFKQNFTSMENGQTIVFVDQIHDYEPIPLKQESNSFVKNVEKSLTD